MALLPPGVYPSITIKINFAFGTNLLHNHQSLDLNQVWVLCFLFRRISNNEQ